MINKKARPNKQQEVIIHRRFKTLWRLYGNIFNNVAEKHKVYRKYKLSKILIEKVDGLKKHNHRRTETVVRALCSKKNFPDDLNEQVLPGGQGTRQFPRKLFQRIKKKYGKLSLIS